MVIVNITSIYSRLDLCCATVWSLIQQERLPDKINIWLSHDAYMADKGVKNSPEWVEQLNKIHNIISVNFTDNIGPYRKIIPALRKYPADYTLVYADDDVVYGKQWLSELCKTYENYNGEYVVASRVRLMKKNIFGQYRSYIDFPLCTQSCLLSEDLLITGVGGCILNSSHIDRALIEDNIFLNLAPRTDDIWLSKIILLSGSKVMVNPNSLAQVFTIEHDNEALSSLNTTYNKPLRKFNFYRRVKNKLLRYFGVSITNNDISIKKVNNHFNYTR